MEENSDDKNCLIISKKNFYEITFKIYEKNYKKMEGNYSEKASKSINLLIQTAYVCYTQGRYAEALRRVYRIEEAVWHLLLYEILYENGYIDEQDRLLYGNKKSYPIIFLMIVS